MVLVRDDHEVFHYDVETDSSDIYTWILHKSLRKVDALSNELLRIFDTLRRACVIAFVDTKRFDERIRHESAHALSVLDNIAQPWTHIYRFAYAEGDEFEWLKNQMGITRAKRPIIAM